ncbi:MAG: hypothetical protein ACYTXE_35105 [Nostoc sp.]
MNQDLKNKVDSIRRSLKNRGLEVPGTVIESKILELYPNYETDWNATTRAEVVKSLTQDHQSTEIVSAIAPTTAQPLTQHQEPEPLAQQETEEEAVSAIAPLDEDTNESVIASLEEVNNSSELALSNAEELIQIAIDNAPSDIKQNLLIQYAQREFESASELIAFKHQIDSQIDEFLAKELHKTATDRNAKWERLQQKIATNADKNLAERKQAQSTFLNNLQARIAEFSISKQEN